MTPFWQTTYLAKEYASKIALIENENEVSYQELHLLVKQRTESLIGLFSNDIPDRKHLWLLATSAKVDFVVSYLALLSLGQLVWLSDSKHIEDNLNYWRKNYDIGFIIDDSNQVTRLSDDTRSVKHHVLADLAILLSTSGTTGSSKLVKLSYNNLVANCASICGYLPISSKDTAVTTLPFHYSFGLSILHTHLASGSALVLTHESLVSPKLWQQIKHYSVSCFYGVPYHYQVLLKLGLSRIPVQSINFFAIAGGKLEPDKALEFAMFCQQKKKQLFLMYGQTEATARMSFLSPQKAVEKPASIGKAIPYGKLILVDENGENITQSNRVGEIVYQGDNVMMGYAESMVDLSQGSVTNRLLTGDIAYFDEDGDLFITGRLSRMLKIAGLRINLEEVESKIESLGFNCAAFGEDDKLRCVIEGENISDANLLKQKLAKMFEFTVHFIEIKTIKQLPRLESGKLDYTELSVHLNESDKTSNRDQKSAGSLT